MAKKRTTSDWTYRIAGVIAGAIIGSLLYGADGVIIGLPLGWLVTECVFLVEAAHQVQEELL